MILEFFAYEFIQRAFIAGLIIALTAPVIGVFMVMKRLSLIGDTLAHTAFAGIALGTLLNFAPIWSALVVTLVSSLGITKIRKSARVSGDAALAVFVSLGLAVGIFLISLSSSFPFNLSSLLFGSILLVTWGDVWLIAGVGLVVSFTVIVIFKEIVHVALDEELAKASGLPVSLLNYLLNILIAVMVVASMRIVGILLVSSLIIIPALTAIQIGRSFRQTMFLSSVFGACSLLIGMVIALVIDSSPSRTIVLSAVTIFLLSLAYRNLQRST